MGGLSQCTVVRTNCLDSILQGNQYLVSDVLEIVGFISYTPVLYESVCLLF